MHIRSTYFLLHHFPLGLIFLENSAPSKYLFPIETDFQKNHPVKHTSANFFERKLKNSVQHFKLMDSDKKKTS